MEDLEQYKESYHKTRFSKDTKRDVLWSSLYRFYFSQRIKPSDCVLDLGSGYGHFINTVQAKKRIAIDCWPEFKGYLEKEVQGIVGDIADLSAISDSSVNYAFASNLFEHISQKSFSTVLDQLKHKMAKNGTLTIIQPNWKFASADYFDDYTHISIYSHISLKDFLQANGWQVITVEPKFLPLTVKGKLPVHPWLIWLYLKSPIKLMGKQMLIVAKVQE